MITNGLLTIMVGVLLLIYCRLGKTNPAPLVLALMLSALIVGGIATLVGVAFSLFILYHH